MGEICKMDTSGLEGVLRSLGQQQVKKVMMKALRAGGKVLQDATRRELAKKLPAATHAPKKIWKKPMTEGVTLKSDKDYDEVRVSVLGDARDVWFELGTKERYLRRTGAKDRERGYLRNGDKRYLYRKKGKETFYRAGTYRGKIKGLHFFEAARADSSAVTSAIEESVAKDLQKIFK